MKGLPLGMLALALTATGCATTPCPRDVAPREVFPGAPDEASISLRPVPLLRWVKGVSGPLRVLTEIDWHQYEILVCSGRAGAPWYDAYFKGDDLEEVDAVVILREGEVLFTSPVSDDYVTVGGDYGLPENSITDLDANGRPEVIVVNHTSGNHSHVTLTWCELEPEFRVAYALDGPADTVCFRQLDDTPALEFVTADREFDAWSCQADYEHIPVPLRYTGGTWKAAVDLMGRRAGDFACTETAEYYLPGSRSSDPEEARDGMRYVLLEYVAAGHEREGWDLVKSWTAVSDAEKADFVKVMEDGLKQSKIWSLVRDGWASRR